jgi:hypothetical protein
MKEFFWLFCSLWASGFHNLHITCPWRLLLTSFTSIYSALSCTMCLLSYTLLPSISCDETSFGSFSGCPWDLRTKSSVGCCCSCPSKFCCYYILSSSLREVLNSIHKPHFLHVLSCRLNFQCQRLQRLSTSSGIVICQSSQRCVVASSFSDLRNSFTIKLLLWMT